MENKVLDFLSDIYFAPIKGLLENEDISDIYIRGPGLILVKDRGTIRQTAGRKFESLKKLETAVNIIARRLGAPLDEAHPILDARFDSGERINLVIPPISQRPLVTIRKFITRYYSANQLISAGMIDQAGLQMLELFVKLRKRIIISGAPNSGKTTILNLVCQHLGPEVGMVVSVEDTREIKIDSLLWESLVANPADHEKSREEKFAEVLINVLRMDADILIIGEIRGAEIIHLVNAFNTGSGGMATIHANSAFSTLRRLEALYRSHSSMREDAIRQVLSENIDIIVHTRTLPDHSKRVSDILEVKKNGIFQVNWLYEFVPEKIVKGQKTAGKFVVGSRPDFLAEPLFISRADIPHFWREDQP